MVLSIQPGFSLRYFHRQNLLKLIESRTPSNHFSSLFIYPPKYGVISLNLSVKLCIQLQTKHINLTDVRVTSIHEDNDTTPYNMGMGGSCGLFCQDALRHNTE